jgi:hypothetical protein
VAILPHDPSELEPDAAAPVIRSPNSIIHVANLNTPYLPPATGDHPLAGFLFCTHASGRLTTLFGTPDWGAKIRRIMWIPPYFQNFPKIF